MSRSNAFEERRDADSASAYCGSPGGEVESVDEWNVELAPLSSHDPDCAYQLHAGICPAGTATSEGWCARGACVAGHRLQSQPE